MGYDTEDKRGDTMRVLIAEDEIGIARGLKALLEKSCFAADIVLNGNDALEHALRGVYDVAVLDIMMPGLDGLSVVHRIRRKGLTLPVLLLTAKSDISDRVNGLNAGADDYLPKPFAPAELVARVNALSRRGTVYSDRLLRAGNTSLDGSRYLLTGPNDQTRLGNKEFQLAELFMSHPGFVFSAEHIMDRIWPQDSETAPDVVWTYIGFVRKKLRQVGSDLEIRTIRGVGYRLEAPAC